ncbi:MAG TPA: hypothetical protein VIK03_07560 [Thermoleophilia bacterium]
MRSTRTAASVRRGGRLLAVMLATLACASALGLVACGGSASSGGSTPAGQASGAGKGFFNDSFMAAWPKAAEAMKAVAPDAVLVASGTMGLALADVPDSWSFTYFSPGKAGIYTVDVEHGRAGTPRQLGSVKQGVKVQRAIDVASINVGAGEAVVQARAYAKKKGTVPKNVVVGGVFAELPGRAAAGYTPGVWTVAFATGTDLADVQTYTVDMMTGVVTKAKAQ